MELSQLEVFLAVAREHRFSLRTLYAVGGAFSGISPIRAVGLGIAKAAREEILGMAS